MDKETITPAKIYDVYRYGDGMIENRFTGTYEECKEYINHRGDVARAVYYIKEQ